MAKDTTSMAGAFPGAPARGRDAAHAAAAPAPAPAPQQSTTSAVANRGAAALKRFDATKLALKQTGAALLHTSETLGATFVGSMAEGYFGAEKLKVGGLDVRAPIGLAAQAFGLYSIATGEKGGEHALAVGNGVTASWLSSVGREAGHALRDRKASPAPAQPAPAGGASFRGESPLVTIPVEPEIIEGVPAPSYQGYPQLPPGPTIYPGQYPQPYQVHPHYLPAPAQYPGWQPQYSGMPSMQGNMVPVEPVQMGATPPGYPQPQMMPYSPVPGAATPGVAMLGAAMSHMAMPGLMPEPTPRVAGVSREIMITPEAGPGQPGRPMPQMMLTPEGASQAPFEGRYVMLTPEGQAQAQASVQAARQRRDSAVQSYQAQQAASQTTSQNSTGTQVAGPSEDFGGPRERIQQRQERRHDRREALRQLGQDRFPSARALNEEPEG